MLASHGTLFQSEDRASQKSKQLSFTLELWGQGIMLLTKDLQMTHLTAKCAELLGFSRRDSSRRPPSYDRLVAYKSDEDPARESAAGAVPSSI